MTASYYQHVRSEIAPLLPARAERIVDVGCGAGGTLAWLRERYPSAHTIGLEGNGALLGALEHNADEAHIVDLDRGEIPAIGEPDLMLFLDVLEHLADPVSVLRRFSKALSPKGAIIVSLPNIAHLSVSIPLLFKGEFTYRDAGILDRTHLRFFDRNGAVALLADAGFTIDRGLMAGIDGPRARLLDTVTAGRMRSRLAKQYILSGAPRSCAPQPPIVWRLAKSSSGAPAKATPLT